MKCTRCRKHEGVHTWEVNPCAAPRTIKAILCDSCDVEINDYILSVFRVRNKIKLMTAYRKRIFG